jgi:hypothetical protein
MDSYSDRYENATKSVTVCGRPEAAVLKLEGFRFCVTAKS